MDWVRFIPVYHASLAPEGYQWILEATGMRLVAFKAEDPECDLHSVMLAAR